MIGDLQMFELTDQEVFLVQRGLLLQQKSIKNAQKADQAAGLPNPVADKALEVLEGKGKQAGLLARFGHTPDEKPKAKKKTDEDPAQRSLDDEIGQAAGDEGNDGIDVPADRRTWSLTKQKVAELVSTIVSDNPPPLAIAKLNALEDGERERNGGSRANVLEVIQEARAPLVQKVKAI